ARYVPEIAILTSNKYIGAGGYGAAQMLSELKYTYDIVWHENDLSKYRLVIIPHGVVFTEKTKAALQSYLRSGGKIISAGSSGVDIDNGEFALPEWSFEFVSKIEKDPKITQAICDAAYTTYFKVLYPTDKADMCYSQYETAISMRAGAGNTTLAEEYNSYFKGPGYDGRHFIYYTPPYESTGNSVIAVNSTQNVAHISFPIFSAYRRSASPIYKDAIKYLLDAFYPDHLIKSESLPVTARATLTGNDEYKLLHVKVTYPEIRGKLGVVEEHNVLPAGRIVAVKGEYSSVKRLPDEELMDFEIKDGYTHITLPQIVGYDMFLIEN
ncbi:MAG: beta-galactosidase trimerization domain-containing protein, partial [Clostridia bacterium]|nr:beta-galactosidase trimerization domain-containing protein [Clostridia bacterium]